VVATVQDAPEHVTDELVQDLLDARGPGAATVRDLVWGSRFHVHHRLADRYRAGRVFVAGDAAHVHSPAGGQGMNTGIQDAVALGDLLVGVAHGADETSLDAYEALRRPIARDVITLTDRATRMATLRRPGPRAARNAALSLAGRLPPVQRRLAMQLSELSARRAAQ
jgi:2-polyprenyl-6-methoxyphenol hydroxylase-like FAD-dependent oxidoreductase